MAYYDINLDDKNSVTSVGHEVFSRYLELYKLNVINTNVVDAQINAISEFGKLTGNVAEINLLMTMSDITKDYISNSSISDLMNELKDIMIAWFGFYNQFDTISFENNEFITFDGSNITVVYDSTIDDIYTKDEKVYNFN